MRMMEATTNQNPRAKVSLRIKRRLTLGGVKFEESLIYWNFEDGA